MAFKLDTDPAGAISDEQGTPVVTGGVYAGEGTHAVNEVAIPVAEGAIYALNAPVTGTAPAAVSWSIEVTAGTETWIERDGYGPDGKQDDADAVNGAGVSTRLWRASTNATAKFSATITGTATVTAPTVAPLTGRIILTVPGNILAETIMASGGFVAGDPNGARLEIDNDGLRAYNSDGAETANIDGAEGVFVGGEFRTSDTLAGQVAISDTALGLSTGNSPGISIEPVNAIGYTTFPGIGPGYDGMVLSGGADANGSSGMVFHPAQVQTWNTGADESYAQSYVTETGVGMERVDAAGQEIAKLYVGQAGIDLRGWANGVTYQMSLDEQGLRVGTSETPILEWLDLLTIKPRLEAIEARITALEA